MESAEIQKELLDLKHLLTEQTWPPDQTIAVLIVASSDILLLIEYTDSDFTSLSGKKTALALVNQALQQLDVIYGHIATNYAFKQELLNQIKNKLQDAIGALLTAYQ